MFANGQTVIQWMEKLAPKKYAVDNDRIGLQLGTLNKEIKQVLVALDVTEEVVEEAIQLKADLIIAHHAIIYRPLQHIHTDSAAGRIYEKCIKNDIAVYISHTNLDSAEGGVNDMLSEMLQLQQTVPLEETHHDRLKKLVVFVPASHLEQVQQAMFQAGAGWIGNYSHCSFNIEGRGTFMPGEGTNPYQGKQGKLEQANELRIETVIRQSDQKRVIQAILKAHPYEEMAYDVYPLELKGKSYGLGRVGRLQEPITLQVLAERVKQSYDVPFTRVTGDLQRSVQKIAIVGGSGSRYVKHALFAGADVLITGDIDYHTAHDALAAGLALIDPGHNVEKIMKQRVAAYLNDILATTRYKTVITASQLNTEPFQLV